MSKKIGIFLMTMLVLWSVLLLDATKNRKPPQAAVPPAESTGAVTEPTASETVPQQTTGPVEVPPEPALEQVKEILDRHNLDRTAVTHRVTDGTGRPANTRSAALAELAAAREMNPIAAFWLLEADGRYEQTGKQKGLPKGSLAELPSQEVKRYAYTDDGAVQLLTDLLTLAARMEDGLELERAILGQDGAVEPDQVHLQQEDCRYAYFARTGEASTQILCFYLRSDTKGKWIVDLEFQLLQMHRDSDAQLDNQTVALAAAAQLLMTGTAPMEAGKESYEVGGFTAEAERFFFTAEEEQGCLTNYRLRK